MQPLPSMQPAMALEEQSITYVSDGLKVKARLFWPEGKGPFPGVIYNHDGVKGLSTSTITRCQELAQNGYAVMAPTYRGEDGSEGTVEVAQGEVNDVLNALKVFGKLPRVDAKRVAFVGTSHGALVSLLAATKTDKVKALVFGYGVADIYSWFDYLKESKQLGDDALTQQVYGKGPEDKPENFRIRHALTVLPNLRVPVLILQGDKDKIVPLEQGQILQTKLTDLHKSSVLKTYPNSGHGFLIYQEREIKRHGADSLQYKESRAAWNEMIMFLDKNLRT
ncbi:MAG: prolyl oligopeptidase family serine peptidase [Gloeobacterales cyanobacterium]